MRCKAWLEFFETRHRAAACFVITNGKHHELAPRSYLFPCELHDYCHLFNDEALEGLLPLPIIHQPKSWISRAGLTPWWKHLDERQPPHLVNLKSIGLVTERTSHLQPTFCGKGVAYSPSKCFHNTATLLSHTANKVHFCGPR